MSGGAYHYLFERIDEASTRLHQHETLRRAFAAHLDLVSAAMKAIEWADSGDGSEDTETPLIRACLAPGAEATVLRADLERIRAEVDTLLAQTPVVAAHSGLPVRRIGPR